MLDFYEVDLNQFVVAIKKLVSGEIENESKDAISKMIEVRKTYKAIVTSIIPFYGVIQSDEKTFVTKFTAQFIAFKQFIL